MLLFGQFNYGETGHPRPDAYRLFTKSSLRTLVTDAGFDIVEEIGIPGAVRQGGRQREALARGDVANPRAPASRVAPRLFAYQFLVVARNRQTTAHILATTRASAYVEAA